VGTEITSTAVLLSAGLDSAVLTAYEARRRAVYPMYISTGLAWESDERAVLNRLLASSPYAGNVEALVHLSFTVEDLYPDTHWARRGELNISAPRDKFEGGLAGTNIDCNR
jgi:hypothetical protein